MKKGYKITKEFISGDKVLAKNVSTNEDIYAIFTVLNSKLSKYGEYKLQLWIKDKVINFAPGEYKLIAKKS